MEQRQWLNINDENGRVVAQIDQKTGEIEPLRGSTQEKIVLALLAEIARLQQPPVTKTSVPETEVVPAKTSGVTTLPMRSRKRKVTLEGDTATA